MNIKDSLVTEYVSQMKEVHKIKVGGSEYTAAVDGVTKLADRIIEIDKIESENSVKWEQLEKEFELKQIQMKEEKRDRMVRNGIEVAKIVGTSGLTAWAFLIAMHFEQTGHIFSTEGGRAALRGLLKFTK